MSAMRQVRTTRWALLAAAAVGGLVIAGARLERPVEAAQEKWAPQFPREGATKVFENDRMIVWDQVWPVGVHMHKHVRDILTIAIEDGPVKIVTPDGEERISPSLGDEMPAVLGYYAAGLGPHAEVSGDPERRPRAYFIEFKGTEPADCADWSTAC